MWHLLGVKKRENVFFHQSELTVEKSIFFLSVIKMMYSVIKNNPFHKIYFSLSLGKMVVLTQDDFKSGLQQ